MSLFTHLNIKIKSWYKDFVLLTTQKVELGQLRWKYNTSKWYENDVKKTDSNNETLKVSYPITTVFKLKMN